MKLSSKFISTDLVGPLTFTYKLLDKSSKQIVVNTIITTILYSILLAIIPFFTKLQLDQLTNPQTVNYPIVLSPTILFISFLVVPGLLVFLQLIISELFEQKLLNKLANRFELSTRIKIWNKLYDFDAGFLESERNKFLFSQTLEAFRLPTSVFYFVRGNLETTVTILTMFPLLFFVSPWLLLLVSTGACIQFLISQKQFTQRMLDTYENQELYRKREAYESILRHNFQQVKQIGESQHFLDKLTKLHEVENDISIDRSFDRRKADVIKSTLDNLVTILINIFVGLQVLNGNMTVGTFTLTIAYTLQLSGIFNRIWRMKENWMNIEFDYFRLSFFLGLTSRWKQSKKGLTTTNPTKLSLTNISFAYPDYYEEERLYLIKLKEKLNNYNKKTNGFWYFRDTLVELENLITSPKKSTEVLADISLHLERGKVTAMIGRNGAGKTTITRLIMHHFEPDSGIVQLDGKPVSEYDQNWLFRQFAILTQKPFIMERFTLYDNLLFGTHTKISQKEIWQVLDEVGLADTVRSLPKQLESVIGEDTRFSGGQEQLLALARVFLQKRPFIILDEGTSQLDLEKEAKILKLLVSKAANDNTGVLFITHRVTTARKADTIIVIDKGAVMEQGTHHSLINNKQTYSLFWNLQVVE
jgi:ABC-type multidrug transport system fused ATPase/permease subunit